MKFYNIEELEEHYSTERKSKILEIAEKNNSKIGLIVSIDNERNKNSYNIAIKDSDVEIIEDSIDTNIISICGLSYSDETFNSIVQTCILLIERFDLEISKDIIDIDTEIDFLYTNIENYF